MALDLDSLVFKVSTKELDDAITKVEQLGTAVSALSKPLTILSKETDKAVKSQKEQTTVQETTTAAIKNNATVLERQQKILEFMTQGMSKGQASVMAMATATGALDKEMKILRTTLESQRKLQGSEPFDRSIGAVKVLKNELGALREAQRQYNSGVELTTKQAKDLYREKFRLIEAMKIERQAAIDIGDSTISESQRYSKLKQDLRDINKEYVSLSAQRNKLANDESLIQTQRKVNNLSRGLAPQISDVAVSLYGGMSPMTVLMQQGLQVRDLIQQSGVEASELNKVMQKTGADFIGTLTGTFKAIGGLTLGVFHSAGKSVTDFLGEIFLLDKATATAASYFEKMGGNAEAFTSKMKSLNSSMITFAATGIGALIIALALMVKGLYDVVQEENQLAKALAQSGGSLGLNLDAALQYAEGMNSLGISTSKAMDVIREMSKTGKLFAGDISLITKTAVDMETYVGASIEDTVKAFAKMRDKPVDSMIELAKATGMVPPEIIKMVAELESQGRSAEASAIAIKTLADVNSQQVDRMKNDYNGFSLFMIELGKSIGNFYDNTFKSVFTKASPKAALEKQLAAVEDILGNNAGLFGVAVSGLGIGKEAYEAQRGAIKEQLSLLDKASLKEQERISNNSFLAGVQKDTEEMRLKQLSKEQKYLNEITVLQNKIAEAKLRGATTDQVSVMQAEITKKSLEYQESLEKKDKKSGSKSEAEKELERFIKLKGDLADKDRDLNANYSESFALIIKLAKTEEERVDLITKLLKQQPLYAAGIKAEAEEKKRIIELFKDDGLAREKILKANEKLINSTAELNLESANYLDRLMLEATLIGLTEEQRKVAIKGKEAEIKLNKELLKIEQSGANDSEKVKAEAAARQRYKEAMFGLNQEIANDAAEKLLAEYNRIRDGITDSIVTALFEGGKAGSKKLRDLVVAELKKPITMVVNALVNTLMNSVTGGVTGSASSGLASSAGGMGVNALFGAGGLGGAMMGGAGWLTGATTLSGSLSAAGSLLTSGISGLLPGLGMLAGALGPIAIGLALFSSLDDSGTYHTGGGASYSATNGATASQIGFTLKEADISQSAVDFAKQFTTAIGTMLDDTAKVFGKTAGYEISTAFADDTSKDGSWGSLVIKKNGQTLVDWQKDQTSKWAPKEFANGEEGKKQYLAAVAKDVRDTLIAEVPDWADTMLDALGDAPSIEGLTQTVISINQTKAAFETMGKASAGFANMTDATTAALIKASGGAALLVASLSSYYSNFYTEEERKVLETNRLYNEFSKLNKVMPTTRQGFRDMMEAAIKAGDTTLVAELLKLSPAFALVTEATKDATEATKDAILAAKEHTESLLKNYDVTKSATDEALRVAKEVINREKDKAVAALASAEAVKSALQSVFDTIKSNIRELYAEVTSTSSMQLSEARAIINEARLTGRINNNAAFTESVSTVRSSFANTNYSSKFESDKARLQFAAELSAIALVTDVQLSAAEQQIQLLKDQILQFDNLILHLDTQLKVLRGIETTNLSIDQALTKLLAVAEAEWAARAAAGLPTNLPSNPAPAPSVPSASDGFVVGGNTSGNNQQPTRGDYGDYHEVTGAFAWEYAKSLQWGGAEDASSTAALADFARNNNLSQTDLAGILGFTPDQIQSHFNQYGIPAFKSGGLHSGGMRLVGEETPELEITGPARYMNASQMYDMMANGSSSGNSDVVNEISLLRYEVRAVVNNTHKLQKLVDNMTTDTNEGVSLRTTQVV